MITRVHVKNYMCLKDVAIRLSPMTVLVGPNASGKSAVLQALRPNHPAWELRWQHADELDMEVAVTHVYDDGREPSKLSGKLVGSDHHFQSFSDKWKGYRYQLLRLSPKGLRQAIKVAKADTLSELGANLANVFYSIGRTRQASVAQELSRLVPAIRDVDVRPLSAGNHILVFEDRWRRDLWYLPEQVSDGTILILAFLVLQYQDPPVELLCIEEPERGLHPYLLGEVVELLRKLAKGELGARPIQVVLATHSPELLDRAEPEEVRFLTRDEKSGSVVVEEAPTDASDWQEKYREYQESLGSAWLSGGLGGVPGGR